MAFTIYDASVPPLAHMLGSFHSVLTKAEAHAKEKGEDVNSYLELRLAPDMLPLTAQVRIATDMSKGGAARLAGMEIPTYEDNETTVEQLKARLLKTIAYLKSLEAAKFVGPLTSPLSGTVVATNDAVVADPAQIGRASCRERV